MNDTETLTITVTAETSRKTLLAIAEDAAQEVVGFFQNEGVYVSATITEGTPPLRGHKPTFEWDPAEEEA